MDLLPCGDANELGLSRTSIDKHVSKLLGRPGHNVTTEDTSPTDAQMGTAVIAERRCLPALPHPSQPNQSAYEALRW